MEKVGFLYDAEMLEPHCIWVPSYPECPSRLKASFDRCCHYNLVQRCAQIPTRVATEDEILLQHSKEYYDLVKKSATMTSDELKDLSSKYDAAYFHPKTFAASTKSAGCAIEAVEQVAKGKVQHSFALIRPPGHHALRSEPCGYCFFNNVAIAAKYAVERLGLKRILIVDWDLHHGQGTQYMFYDDPRVLYFSIHRYEHGTFWPNLRESDFDYVGQGFNVNVPFNKVGMKDGDYMSIMHQVLMPLAYEFNPELVIISSGYDAAIGDAEGRSEVTPACYAHFTHLMKGLAGGKLAVIFEGGYCLKSLAEGVALTLRCLLDDPCPQLPPLSPPMDSTKESILKVISVLRPFWKCFAYQDDAQSDDDLPGFLRNIVIPKKGVVFMNDATRPPSFTLDGYENYTTEEIDACDKIIDDLINKTSLRVPPNRTSLVFDERMCLHKATRTDKVFKDDHPDKPCRITLIYDALKDRGFVDRCKRLPSRTASKEEIGLVHSKEFIEEVESFQTFSGQELGAMESKLDSIYLAQETFLCASLAIGCILNVIDDVLTGKSQNGFAVVRPPGHHAEVDEPKGFCIFNNVAIAAKYAQQRHGVQKVLIVDWDMHHGNGIQHIFENDPSVLYVSIHLGQMTHPAYPFTDDKFASDVGSGPGKGYNINIAWPQDEMGDSEYIAVFQQIILPVAYEFSPDVVLVSAGFDAAVGDPLGGCKVTPVGYAHLTHLLSSLAGGRLILVLEGGYNLNILPECAASCVSVLLGDAVPNIVSLEPPSKSAVGSILQTIDVLRHYWTSLYAQIKMPSIQQTLAWLKEKGHETGRVGKRAGMDAEPGSSGEQLYACCGGQSSSDSQQEHLFQMLLNMAQGENSLELHAVEPIPWCPHLDAVGPVPRAGLNTSQDCSECGVAGENWVCLTCYEVLCSRYHNSHMVEHNRLTDHPVALSFADLSFWCYPCDAYIKNERLMEVLRRAYEDKFHETMAEIH